MTYISHNDVYENGIHELSFDEISEVGGGPVVLVPLIVPAVKIAGGILAGIIAANAVGGLIDGLAGNPEETEPAKK